MRVARTKEFENWLGAESAKGQALVEARIFRLENYDHFGDARYLGEGLAELKWKIGLRVYFARTRERTVLLVLGGWKNDQKKDIKEARVLLQGYAGNFSQNR